MIQLGDHFRRDERSRHSEWLRRRKWFINAREGRIKRDELAEETEEAWVSTAVTAIIASDMQIAEFKQQLEIYDAAITESLLENEDKLALLNERLAETERYLEQLLMQAHVLEDGRRVFKSEDGTFLIDEFGVDVGKEEVDFDLVIGPSAETYLAGLKLKQDDFALKREILEERDQLYRAETILREKEAAIEEGFTTVQELEKFDAEILDALPPSAIAKLPEEISPIENAPKMSQSFKSSSSPAPNTAKIRSTIEPTVPS